MPLNQQSFILRDGRRGTCVDFSDLPTAARKLIAAAEAEATSMVAAGKQAERDAVVNMSNLQVSRELSACEGARTWIAQD